MFPFEPSLDIDALLLELIQSPGRFIMRYSVGGEHYLTIPSFEKHQHFHIGEKASTLPPPSESDPLHDACTVLAPDLNGTKTPVICNLKSYMVDDSASEPSEVTEEIGKHDSKPAQKRKPFSNDAEFSHGDG